MNPKQMKHVANNEVDKLRLIKDCVGHDWQGPSQEVAWGNTTKYLYHCKHCPLAKLFDEAQGVVL